MKATKLNKVLCLAVSAIALSSATGCTVSSLGFNIWTGFGNALGAIPGVFIGDLLFGFLGL